MSSQLSDDHRTRLLGVASYGDPHASAVPVPASLSPLGRMAPFFALAAAALIVVHEILALVVGRPQPSEIAEFLREAVVAIVITLDLAGFTLLLLALTDLFERQAHALGKLGLAGYLIAFVGTVLAAGDWWFELFGTPYFAELAPRAAEQPASGRLLLGGQVTFYSFAAGWTMFGIASVRARVYPRAAAILLISRWTGRPVRRVGAAPAATCARGRLDRLVALPVVSTQR